MAASVVVVVWLGGIVVEVVAVEVDAPLFGA